MSDSMGDALLTMVLAFEDSMHKTPGQDSALRYARKALKKNRLSEQQIAKALLEVSAKTVRENEVLTNSIDGLEALINSEDQTPCTILPNGDVVRLKEQEEFMVHATVCKCPTACRAAKACQHPKHCEETKELNFTQFRLLGVLEKAAETCERVRDDNSMAYNDSERLVCENCAHEIRALKGTQS